MSNVNEVIEYILSDWKTNDLRTIDGFHISTCNTSHMFTVNNDVANEFSETFGTIDGIKEQINSTNAKHHIIFFYKRCDDSSSNKFSISMLSVCK